MHMLYKQPINHYRLIITIHTAVCVPVPVPALTQQWLRGHNSPGSDTASEPETRSNPAPSYRPALASLSTAGPCVICPRQESEECPSRRGGGRGEDCLGFTVGTGPSARRGGAIGCWLNVAAYVLTGLAGRPRGHVPFSFRWQFGLLPLAGIHGMIYP